MSLMQRSITLRSRTSHYKLAPRDAAVDHAGYSAVSEFSAGHILQDILRSKNRWGRQNLLRLAFGLLGQSLQSSPSVQTQTHLLKALKRALHPTHGMYVLLKQQRYVHSPMMTDEKAEEPWVFEEDLKHWVEVQLIDEDDNPLSDFEYEIKLPDGSTRKSKTNQAGVLRYPDIPEGLCEFCLVVANQVT